MNHDLMRGIKGGQPFYLMEQTPSVTNWLPYNALKRPGGMGLLIWQAVAHGGDSVLFFQMRRSIGACEKYHGALMDHAGHEHTRVFREMQALGRSWRHCQMLPWGPGRRRRRPSWWTGITGGRWSIRPGPAVS